MDRDAFAKGMTYEQYTAAMQANRVEAEAIYRDAGAPADLRDFLQAYANRHGGVVHVAVFSDDRCPDCLENVPVLARLASEVPGFELRVFRRGEHQEALAALFPEGKARVPAFAFYDSDWRHLMTWIERPEGATRFLEDGLKDLRRRLHEEYQNRFRAEMLNEVRSGLMAAEQ
ncbi:MAG: thioredoxin family protein [Chloroflexota bacterium]